MSGNLPLRDQDGAQRDPDESQRAQQPAREPSARDIFSRLFADCLPRRSLYRGPRKWIAGYRRMVAIVYTVSPDYFDGMTQEEVAAHLDLDITRFRRLQRSVEAQLAGRARTGKRHG